MKLVILSLVSCTLCLHRTRPSKRGQIKKLILKQKNGLLLTSFRSIKGFETIPVAAAPQLYTNVYLQISQKPYKKQDSEWV